MIVRPAELIPGCEEWPFYEVLIVASLLLALPTITRRLAIPELPKRPILLCAAGLLLAVMLSHITHGSLGEAAAGASMFGKTLLYFLLLTIVVDTPLRLAVFLRTTAMAATFVVGLCAAEYHGMLDLPGIQHLVDWDMDPATGIRTSFLRMRGTGLFQDPNDISLLIVASSVLCLAFFLESRSGGLRYLWLVGNAVNLIGLLATQSRGGLLAAGAAGFAYAILRMGRNAAITLSILGALAVPVALGRQAQIDLEEGTGAERIVLWREGFEELKSPQLLFGTGQGTYSDLMGYVAHNSYVHAFVELGLFGGILFFSMFFLLGLGLYRIRRVQTELRDPRFARLLPYVAAVAAGWAVGLFSLSRCYVVPTYTILGLGTAYISIAETQLIRNLAGPRGPIALSAQYSGIARGAAFPQGGLPYGRPAGRNLSRRCLLLLDRRLAWTCLAASLGMLVFLNLFVRVVGWIT